MGISMADSLDNFRDYGGSGCRRLNGPAGTLEFILKPGIRPAW